MATPPSISFEQALTLLQSGQHRRSPHPSSETRQSSQPAGRTRSSAIIDSPQPIDFTFQDVLALLRAMSDQATPSPTFQEALAGLHNTAARSHDLTARSRSQPHNSHSAARQVTLSGEGPRLISPASLFDDIQIHRRPLHQEATAPPANRNSPDVADRWLHHREVRHNHERHRRHSNESDTRLKLANLPSLSVEEACKTIHWRSATKIEGVNCGICLEDLESEDKVHLFPNCNHLFHVECVKDWLLRVGSCPCCRDVIIEVKNSPHK